MDKITSSCSKLNGQPDSFVVTREGTAYADDKLVENKKRAVRMLDKLDQPQLQTELVGNLPREFMTTMLSKMVCLACQHVPSPYSRFICKNGHIVCQPCVEKRFLDHGDKCLIENQKKKFDLALEALKKRDSSTLLPIPPVLTLGYWAEDPKEEDEMDFCQETLRRYPADPIFTGIWSRALWKCPAGCNEVLEGRKLLSHFCRPERKTKPESNSTDATKGSDYTSEPSGSEDVPTVLFRHGSGKNDISTASGQVELKPPFGCSVAGCSQQVFMKGVVEHLILSHRIYAMDAEADQRTWRTTGLLNIPQSAIEARRPFYSLIRCYSRFFLFCVEPSTLNSSDMGFWIRRISKKENKEEEDGPYFTYDFGLMDILGDTQVVYKKVCASWDKPSGEVFAEKQCFQMPVSFLLDQFALNCDDENPAGSCEAVENRRVPVKFSITVANFMGDLYSDDGPEATTSSMESLAVIDNDTSDIEISLEDFIEDTTTTEDDD